METEIKKEIIKKLSPSQLFWLCVLVVTNFALIVFMLCLLAPDALPSLFNIFNG